MAEQQKTAEEPKTETEQKTAEEIKKEEDKGPTFFQLLGMEQNRDVFNMFKFVSLALIIIAFGSFYLLRTIIPMIWTNVPRKDACYTL